jgi:hypothetical protein
MVTNVNIVACTGIRSAEMHRKPEVDGRMLEERNEYFRTVLKPAGEFDTCPDLKKNIIYEFDDFCWFRIAHRERDYNEWLNKLARVVGYNYRNANSREPGPFRELFWTASYDVTYGPKFVVKLALDFSIWRALVERNEGHEFVKTYNFFSKILDYASLNGAFWFEPS